MFELLWLATTNRFGRTLTYWAGPAACDEWAACRAPGAQSRCTAAPVRPVAWGRWPGAWGQGVPGDRLTADRWKWGHCTPGGRCGGHCWMCGGFAFQVTGLLPTAGDASVLRSREAKGPAGAGSLLFAS